MQRVGIATNLFQSGLQNWLLQRVTAVILILYLLFWIVCFARMPTLSYQVWKTLFESELLRIVSLLVLLALLMHAWMGIWTVLTDYVKVVSVRLILQYVFGLGLLLSLFWGIRIFWGY